MDLLFVLLFPIILLVVSFFFLIFFMLFKMQEGKGGSGRGSSWNGCVGICSPGGRPRMGDDAEPTCASLLYE